MKRKGILKETGEFLLDYGKIVVAWIGICSAIQQFLVNFMFEALKHILKNLTQSQITYWTYIICLIGIAVITIRSIYNNFKSEFVIKVKADREQKIILKLGGYEENMEEVLTKATEEKKEAIFVIGINDEVSMDIAEKRGVHRAVMEKFYRDKNRTEDLQLRVNKVFNKEEGKVCDFGDIGLVSHSKDSQIMFVVNSKFEGGQSTSILGPQTKDIIKNVFKTLEKQSVEVVQLPILSSRNVRCIENSNIRFSITIAEIIEEYFKALLNTSNIDYDIVLSIRKEDLKDNSISARDIVKFIKDLKPMYHIK